jgi:uncharacterized membrane protein
MPTNAQLLLMARVLISIALLTWAGIDLVVNPALADHPTAITIIGVVLGYWLGHAENSAIGLIR